MGQRRFFEFSRVSFQNQDNNSHSCLPAVLLSRLRGVKQWTLLHFQSLFGCSSPIFKFFSVNGLYIFPAISLMDSSNQFYMFKISFNFNPWHHIVAVITPIILLLMEFYKIKCKILILSNNLAFSLSFWIPSWWGRSSPILRLYMVLYFPVIICFYMKIFNTSDSEKLLPLSSNKKRHL